MNAEPMDTRGFVIRKAQVADAEEISRLAAELGYPIDPEDIAFRLADLLGWPDHAVRVAEGEGGKLAGWIHAGAVGWLQSGSYAEIGGLIVDPSMRGRGIGAQLVAAASNWAASLGFEELRVRSNVVRAEAHRFYQRLGFVATKTQQVFHRSLRGEPPAVPPNTLPH
jgi:GNAT superfamily N-acetyltransferase